MPIQWSSVGSNHGWNGPGQCSRADYENLIAQAKKYDLGQVAVGSECWVPFVAGRT